MLFRGFLMVLCRIFRSFRCCISLQWGYEKEDNPYHAHVCVLLNICLTKNLSSFYFPFFFPLLSPLPSPPPQKKKIQLDSGFDLCCSQFSFPVCCMFCHRRVYLQNTLQSIKLLSLSNDFSWSIAEVTYNFGSDTVKLLT